MSVTMEEAREFWEELKDMAGCHRGHDWEQRFHFADGSETNYQDVECQFYSWYCRKCRIRVGSCSKPDDVGPWNTVSLHWDDKEKCWVHVHGSFHR